MSLITYLCLSVILIHSTATTELENRILGGKEFRPYEHTYLVGLKVYYFQSTVNGLCSGSILSNRWILSAAHCFPDNITSVEATQQFMEQTRLIGFAYKSHIATHPGYIHGDLTYQNLEIDLALVKTATPIVYGDFTWWIPLPINFAMSGDLATIAGYGEWEYGKFAPRAGQVFIRSCEYALNSKVLCSYTVARAGHGDSGGALVANGVLVGVTSAYRMINVLGTVYVDVFRNLDWIVGVMTSI